MWAFAFPQILGPPLALFEVALSSSLSPECLANKGIYAMILIVQYLGERAGERGVVA
jgi:hypothetical protein